MPTTKRVRARIHGRILELLEDVHVSANEVTVTIEIPAAGDIARAREESAGAWTDEAHSDLKTRDDVASHVRIGREAFDRYGA